MMECPYCGKRNAIHAVHGKIKTFSCLNCGKGVKTGINGHSTIKKVILDFWGLQEKMLIHVDGRIVTLPEFTAEQRKELGEWVGGFA